MAPLPEVAGLHWDATRRGSKSVQEEHAMRGELMIRTENRMSAIRTGRLATFIRFDLGFRSYLRLVQFTLGHTTSGLIKYLHIKVYRASSVAVSSNSGTPRRKIDLRLHLKRDTIHFEMIIPSKRMSTRKILTLLSLGHSRVPRLRLLDSLQHRKPME